jgi:hypothetical protein
MSSKDDMFAKIILGSIGATNIPIYSMHWHYPRPIHGEVMTHKDFSRNARSSRAVPVRTMLNEVRTNPYVPWHWGANQKGMQAGADNSTLVSIPTETGGIHDVTREDAWRSASRAAAAHAEAFMDAEYHKQNPNRLLEPFAWIDTLITTTKLANFMNLRDHAAAEPHFRDLAQMVKEAVDNHGDCDYLEDNEWHQPYINKDDHLEALRRFPNDFDAGSAWLNKISSARCARISYKPFGDGDASYGAELERYDMLANGDAVHASPFEHQAKPDTRVICPMTGQAERWENPGLHRNLTGWIQNRALIQGEYVKDVWHG